MPCDPGGNLGAVGQVQAVEDALDMAGDGALDQRQLLRDLGIGPALRDELRHVQLY